MDIHDLRVFEAAARLGGMNRAAVELNTVQSNVTTRIRLLEERIGTPLFRRHSKGVTLTNAGERLLPYAMEIARLLDEARRSVEDDGKPKGDLTIGSMESTAAYRLPSVISSFCKAYPAVSISLRTGTNAKLIQEILDYSMDGAFVCGPIDHPDLDQELIFRERLVLATSPGQNRLEIPRTTPYKILVKGPGCAYRERFEDLLSTHGIRFSRMEFGTLDAIIECVAEGLGDTLLPESVLAQASSEGRISIHPLNAAETEVDTVFVWRHDTFSSSALSAFRRAALSTRQFAVAAQ
jgi:LysR family transcriptional regulator, cell division regulator